MTPLEENETFEDDIDSLIDLKLRVSGMKKVQFSVEWHCVTMYEYY